MEDNKPLSLEERLKLATQTKKPGAEKTPTLIVEEVKPQPAQTKAAPVQPQTANFDDWNSLDDFDKTTPVTTSPGSQTQPGTTTTPGEKKPSVAEMRAGARSFTAAINMGQRMLFTNLSKSKALKPFSPEELDLINKIDFLPKALLSDPQQGLLAKYHKAYKKHERITKEIPFTDTELKDWEMMLMMYQEETGKAIPQWLYGLLTAVTTLGKRGFDVYFD